MGVNFKKEKKKATHSLRLPEFIWINRALAQDVMCTLMIMLEYLKNHTVWFT